jgi:hypothetical protein
MITGALLLHAQNSADSIPEPEFMNQIFAVGKDHKLINLEKKDAEYVSKMKAAGFGGSKQIYQIEGGQSTVSLAPDYLMFVVSTGGGFGMDPTAQFALMKFNSNKDKRQALVAESGRMTKKGTSPGDNEIPLNFKKLREGVTGIVAAKPLEKGEYAFLNKMSIQGGGMSMKMEAYAFNIQ